VPVPLVLRSEDFEGDVECEGGYFGRDISPGGLGDYMVSCMARLKQAEVGKFKANRLPGSSDQVT
jgi:hypothetical protein